MSADPSKCWWWPTTLSHAEADEDCGREWSCSCGPCRSARADGETPDSMAAHVAFARLERTSGRLAAIQKVGAL